jgi:apolipoprotein N-acyltransferase
MSITGAVLGKMELNAIRQGRAPAAGETMAKIGFYLGVGSAGLWIVWTVINLVFGLVGGLSDILRNMGR